MSRRFVLSPEAEADIDLIAEYLARESIDAALRFYDATTVTLDELAQTPLIGRQRDFADPDFAHARSWSIRGFRSILVIYLPVEHGIRVLRVMHGARDLIAKFGGD